MPATDAEEAEEESVDAGAIEPQSVINMHRKHGHGKKHSDKKTKDTYEKKENRPYGKDTYENKPGYGKDGYGEPGKDYYKTEHEYHGKHGYKEDRSGPYERDYESYGGHRENEHR